MFGLLQSAAKSHTEMGDSSRTVGKKSQKRKREDNITHNDFDTSTKKLCFWGKGDLEGNLNFFVVNVSIDKQKNELTKEIKELAVFDHNLLHTHTASLEKELSVLTPIFSFPIENSNIPLVFNSFATLGSLIYSIGGIFTLPERRWGADSKKSGSNLVHYFDTTLHDDIVWKQGPPMLTHRQNPQVLTANEKMFVFGCFGEDKCPHEPNCVWAESLDVSIDEWTPLPVPEFESSFIICSTTLTKKNKVAKKMYALIDYGIFHEYDIETNCWTCIANYQKNFSGIISQPTMVNNVLYWSGNDLLAYDILKDREFEGPVQDFSFQRAMRKPKQYDSSDDEEEDDRPISIVKPAVFHLGGRYFCFMGFLHDLEEDNPRRIHCLIIKVSRTNECYKLYKAKRQDVDKFFLGARVISCQSFVLDQELHSLNGRVMI